MAAGSTLGIVGESGSGKSTLIRVMCGLLRHQRGTVRFDGRDLSEFRGDDSTDLRRRNQIVFQNPRRSLDPRMTVRRSLSEPLRACSGADPTTTSWPLRSSEWVCAATCSPGSRTSSPAASCSGSAIARALAVDPTILYADEPVSALDVSVQAQVLNLLMDLQDDLGLTLVMVSHDLSVVSRMCEEIVVMRDGQIVEAGRTATVLKRPESTYTAALLNAAQVVSLHQEVRRPT